MGDAELVIRAVRGDRSAVELLLRRHVGTVRAVVLAQLGPHPDADDIVQETLLGAFQRLHTLREPARLAAWLRGIARNQVRVMLRRPRRGEPVAPERLENLPAAEDARPATALEADRPSSLAVAVAGLPEKLREALVLFYVERQSYAEIGARLGISAAAVNRRLTRARQLLRERLDGERRQDREDPHGAR